MTTKVGQYNQLMEKVQSKSRVAYINKVFLDKITESLPQYIFWKDRNSVYLGCNKNFSDLVGLSSPEAIVGKTDYDLNWQSTGHTAETFQEGDRKTLAGDVITNQEEILALPNGKKLITIVSKSPIIDEGEAIGIVGYFTDITEVRKAEERERQTIAKMVEERMKAKSEEELRAAIMVITGSIVHDLRTPITTVNLVGGNMNKFLPEIIAGYKKAVDAGLLEDPLKSQILSNLENSGHTLKSVSMNMNDYIDHSLKTLSKTLVKDLTQEDLTKCSMERCIRETMARYPFEADELQRIEVDYDNDFHFMGNTIMMIRVLTNLIKNSLYQINKNQKGDILIRMERRLEHNVLFVKDTAGGIPDEFISTLFEGYQTTKKDGTGVGLAFCQKAINDFGGKIECQSNHDDYIEFIITFSKVNHL
ncbi:MAG: PAS domain-containing protein [Legionellales bacterium]|nr:PAS domain-containing protein [Legionellales bacterium]